MPANPAVHLILFSRAPVAGAGKTRLAADVGAEAARQFHVACLLDALDEAQAWQAEAPSASAAPIHLHAFITPPNSQGDFARAGIRWPAALRLHNQSGATLGARMHHALRTVLAAAPGAALLVGTDLPLLGRAVLASAVRALESADVVFGPTPDGGYYLVGVKQPQPRLFAGPAWGGSTVLEQSVAAAEQMGLRTARVAALPDVDVASDIPRVLSHPLAAGLDQRRALRLLRQWVEEGRVPVPRQ
jgi:hypothetical protein